MGTKEESYSEEVRGPGRGPLGGVRGFGGRAGVGTDEHAGLSDGALYATRIGYPEAALWVDEHRHEYSEGVFRGFVATE
jgi:hypothetical protein